jgi:hypothetical protein
MSNNVSRAAFILILNIVSIHSFAQGFQIDGQINDQQSGNPIPFVTVYIDGTTRGTTTDQLGQFVLQDITLPCELILSHVSYQLKSIPLQDSAFCQTPSTFFHQAGFRKILYYSAGLSGKKGLHICCRKTIYPPCNRGEINNSALRTSSP